jgi:hypothetical protein
MLQYLSSALSGRIEPADWPNLDRGGWDLLVGLAEKEGVASLLCRAFDERGWPDRIPANVRQILRRANFTTAASNLLLYGELTRILAALQPEKALPTADSRRVAVVLKGADLAMTAYPSIALRPMCDLDLLLPRPRLDEAVRTLEHLGYQKIGPEIAAGHDLLTAHAVPMVGGPGRSVMVELHWRLVASEMDRRSPALDWFWTQTEPWCNGDRSSIESGNDGDGKVALPTFFFHLTPTAHLLYLAAHLALQHGTAQSRLLWFYDIDLLVTLYGDRIDWDELLHRARELRWNLTLLTALTTTGERFGTAYPRGFLEAIAENANETASRVERFKPDLTYPRGSRIWHQMMCLAWRGRLSFAWNHFFPSRAYVRSRYPIRPRWLWPICYPYRWSVIAAEGIKALLHRVGRVFRASRKRGAENPKLNRGVKNGGDRPLVRALKAFASDDSLRLRVNGCCMAPLVKHGDSVEVSKAKYLWPGDVIAFWQKGQVKLHRLIGYRLLSRRLALVTQGDSNPSCDSYSDAGDVIGRISGGECSPLLVNVPLRHRIWALGRFGKLVFRRLSSWMR